MNKLRQYSIILVMTLLGALGNVFAATRYTSLSSLPNSRNVYTLPEGDELIINGNLTINNNQTLIISSGSVFIVNGNLTIEEKGTLQLCSNSKTYIKNDLYQDGHSPLGWGLAWVNVGDIETDHATVIVGGRYDIWNNYQYSDGEYLNNNNGNSVYVFGDSDVGNLGNKTTFKNDYDIDNDDDISSIINSILYPPYPKCYLLPRKDGSSEVEICTDANGDIDINLNDAKFNGSPVYIPENLTIECRNFTIRYRDQYNEILNGKKNKFFIEGKIISTGTFELKKLGYDDSNGSQYVEFGCKTFISANIANIGYVYTVPNFKGIWMVDKLNINNGQGQDLNFSDCSFVKANEININANISNGVIIEGHIITDNVVSPKDIKLKYSGTSDELAILTIGALESAYSWSNVKIIADENTVVNFCSNPTKGDGGTHRVNNSFDEPNGADRIGFFKGFVLYNYGEDGWNVEGVTPQTEWDINPEKDQYGGTTEYTRAKKLIAAYTSYANCINEVDMASFLPIELVSFSYDKPIGKFYWTTASETDNDYFVVEYSKNGKDWTECTEHVVSMSNTGYAYNTEPIIPINESLFSYFRLKQVDLNGAYSYSDIITVSFTVENPCSPEFENKKIQIRELGNKWFRNINGELIYCENDNE